VARQFVLTPSIRSAPRFGHRLDAPPTSFPAVFNHEEVVGVLLLLLVVALALLTWGLVRLCERV